MLGNPLAQFLEGEGGVSLPIYSVCQIHPLNGWQMSLEQICHINWKFLGMSANLSRGHIVLIPIFTGGWRKIGHHPQFVPSILVFHHNIDTFLKFILHEFDHGKSFAQVRVSGKKVF